MLDLPLVKQSRGAILKCPSLKTSILLGWINLRKTCGGSVVLDNVISIPNGPDHPIIREVNGGLGALVDN